jgi:hypothetical protein
MDHLRLELGQLWKPGYYKNIFDSSKHRFHDFPNTIGWVLSDETLEFKPDPAKTAKIKFDQFLQSWLFFGLLHTVLQKPSKELSRAGALVSDSEEFINTTNLNNYLEGWSRDVAEQDTHSRSLRMIRAQVALERACRVVREYCSDDGKMKKPEGHPCYVDPVLGLSLMVLGETLTNAKSKIAEKSGLSITGWHGDPMEGWGTPTCVLEKMMDDGWCRKLVEVLKLQLRSHATSILAAFASHEQNNAKTAYLIEGHEECTKDRCKLKFVESGGKYVTQHQLSCPRHPKHRNHSNDESVCKFIPLEIKDVVKHLEKHHIPLLEYNKEEGKVTVQKYEPYTPYATLSHVWSDGYGNPDANLLWRCQLDFFDDLFREAQQEERKLFWIDTLAIPIQEEYKKYRRIAIRQIHQVYTNARYTIVIDKGLGGMSRADSYEATAMRILASNWMRRLWTLQEAYLSRRLYFAFAPGAKGRLKNLEDLEEMYPKANDILTSNIPSAARNYFHNLLGNDRRARINELAAGEGIDVMASVWRAARWRVRLHPVRPPSDANMPTDYQSSRARDLSTSNSSQSRLQEH